ncbi:MAG: PTS sugar transporter subunit IIA [Burkholderiaceae bacterium]
MTTCLFLVCHAPLASALHAVACHGFGRRLDEVEVIDVLASQSPEQVEGLITERWEAMGRPPEVLLLSDLAGATPANGIARWLGQHPGEGVAAASLPTLLRALTYKSLNAKALRDKLCETERSGCCSIVALSQAS